MDEFTVNPKRFDPYKNFKFRLEWDGRHLAGVIKVSGLRRFTEVIRHRESGDPRTTRKFPKLTEFAPITLEQLVKQPVEPPSGKRDQFCRAKRLIRPRV